ncbi:MAG: tetratricopeptide repeat protein [Planctomycetaceae bacterium]
MLSQPVRVFLCWFVSVAATSPLVGTGVLFAEDISSPNTIYVPDAASSVEASSAVDAITCDDDGKAPAWATALGQLQTGQYAEAKGSYERLLASEDVETRAASAIGLSRVAEETGDWKMARLLLDDATKRDADRPELWGRLAEVQFLTGDHKSARASAERAIALDENELRSRLILARLLRESGQVNDAVQGFVWFIRYYNRHDVTDAESLVFVAEGALEYARAKRSSSTFDTVLNDLCPDALKDNPQWWQASLLSGNLLLEKYNRSECNAEFKSVLKTNPNSAQAYAALAQSSLQDHEFEEARQQAEEALKHNPVQLEALLVLVDLELEQDDIVNAQTRLKQAVEVNRLDQRVLARQAALHILTDTLPSLPELELLFDHIRAPAEHPIDNTAPQSALAKLILELAERNPAPGLFLNDLGEFLESRRKHREAELVYETAVAVMPSFSTPKNNLGMLYMATGRVADAERMLDEAFQKDPFHVRVSNMRKVIKVLNSYETIRTDHFLISVDASDRMLGEYMADYLEEVHAELTAEYGFSPDDRTRFEIYADAKGQTAHAWFSARMVGLPWIQTIGASTGMIVALASPRDVPGKFHWARVLKHEYVHILTLQQTEFNIPHWYTEALAVRSEGMAMPAEWNRLLLERVPAGTAFTLDNVNNGFRRPKGPDDWSMAYCQSRLYARYLEETYGSDSLPKLIDCYKRNLATPAAIQEVTGVSVVEFEAGYLAFLKQLVARIEQSQAQPTLDVVAARKSHQEQPENLALAGRYAYALFDEGTTNEARKVAEGVQQKDPSEPFAAATMARLAMSEGETATARKLLLAAHKEEQLHPVILALLAEVTLDAKEFVEAARLYELGVKTFPEEDEFLTGLSIALLEVGDKDRLRATLTQLADRDTTDLGARLKLAELALERHDFAQAKAWGREMMYVDVDDPRGHVVLGDAAMGMQDWSTADKEYAAALELAPDSLPARLGLARSAISSNHPETARPHLKQILADHPDHKEAQTLLDKLPDAE